MVKILSVSKTLKYLELRNNQVNDDIPKVIRIITEHNEEVQESLELAVHWSV